MLIDLTGTNNVPDGGTVVAMGLFDGLHCGHRAVVRYAADIAKRFPGMSPAVFTFDTASVTSKGDGGVDCILSREIKFELLEDLGVKYVYSPDFSNFKDLDGDGFVQLVLGDKLCAECAVCGEDFRFGKDAKWGVKELDALCRKRGIKLYSVPKVTENFGERISSTMIRSLIREGNIERANLLMGSGFALKLPVAYGRQLGRKLDFPTINQYIPKRQLAPKYGVYASRTEVCGGVYKSVTNIGVKPTVGSDAPLAETYIIDYSGEELYGETAKVTLTAFMRPERKFGSVDELKAQIAEDVRRAREIPDRIRLLCEDTENENERT